ncbi:sacsin N-terminal ATP-binding-like domain-containing protein [Rhodococcus pyridinivorans]|uniref:sacsin N-terminal ATP-binding-like domain-containing protein n=1 Tax=Rhodococcus TaxID=1827 RepID=UPI000903A3C4|nr:ATP-binding protein [Rhodococcus sp. 2G]APE09312.1 hypothetical protein BO226_08905 [Rhodococcus sp. 2G]
MTDFRDLTQLRRDLVAITQANGFEEGLRTLLADLYPDNAHFIYELLQNAEDAGAHTVNFDLRNTGLRVEHDGNRMFDLGDIDSITSIGHSTKANDATRIGKFGVGFKAVFAYTSTPEIRSGETAFAIHDLFVPVPLEGKSRGGWTTFWFPFDRDDKPADIAVIEVARALHDLAHSTLLFLTNIRSIGYTLADGSKRELVRQSLGNNIARIKSVHEEQDSTYWYRLIGDVDVAGSKYSVAAAFALEPHASKDAGPKNFSVKPTDGKVFIYFPAAKETSGLKFHIHAPFASTVARDSVRDDPNNDILVRGIATLVTAALPQMRDAGLITSDMLAALPHSNDPLPSRYAVIGEQVRDAFNTRPLTPTVDNGIYAPATTLFRAEAQTRAILSVDDATALRALGHHESTPTAKGWIPEREGRARAFLADLDTILFDRSVLSATLTRVAHAYVQVERSSGDQGAADAQQTVNWWNDWIGAKSDSWLRRFYMALEAVIPKPRVGFGYGYRDGGASGPDVLRSAPLIRVQDGEGVRHVPGLEAYMPTVPGLEGDGLVVDSLAVFAEEDDTDINFPLRDFYSRATVRKWDAKAQLDTRLSAYGQIPRAITDEHIADLKVLEQLIADKAVAGSDYSGTPLLLAVQRNGSRYWAKPRDVFVDEPFASTGLAALYESDEYQGVPPGRLDPEYAQVLADACTLACALGAVSQLRIAAAEAKKNREFRQVWVERENRKSSSTDWTIPHFDAILSSDDETLLRGLWELVAASPVQHANASYRANGSSPIHTMRSQLLQALQTTAWILDRDGNLRKPEDITAEELAEGLSAPSDSPLLDRAGFGRKAAVSAQERIHEAEVARKYGFESFEDFRRIADVRKRDPDRFKSFLDHIEAELRLPEEPASAPELRAQRAAEASTDAPTRRYEQKLRSVLIQVPGHRSDARGYLRQFYTNDDGVMICQVCSEAMPFKIEGQYYFEAVQFVADGRQDLRENRLALCPTCAAKYRHAQSTTDGERRTALLSQHIGFRGSVLVPVVLAEEDAFVRFVGKHAIDLQAALAVQRGDVAGSPSSGPAQSR